MTIEGKVRESDWKVPHSQGEDASSGPHRGCRLSLEAGQGKEVSPPPPQGLQKGHSPAEFDFRTSDLQNYRSVVFFSFFLAKLCGVWDLSSPTRD